MPPTTVRRLLRPIQIRTIMKQAQVAAWGEPPKCIEVPAPAAPAAGHVQVKLLAAGLHNLVRARAAGLHYSAKTLPHIPGSDGVGTLDDGTLVYFSAMTPAGGSMAERINVPAAATTPLPAGADPIQVAGLANPVMASWMALATRTSHLPPAFTAVIVGATTVSGTAAVSVLRAFGATRVVGIARPSERLAALALDATIELREDDAQTDYAPAADADVVLDFLYGAPTLHLLQSLKPTKPVQYVQIGTTANKTLDLPGEILRSKDITVRGSGPGAWQMSQFAEQSPKVIDAIATGRIAPLKFRIVKLDDVEHIWGEKGGERIVIVP
ncbi:Alcohol dehydrogenase superfamily zinc-containing [Macrophomina phaseolina MS6]|uniref:Alcohol dehydrogenase superfamily zinc-containing n=1 Tax=Macrophomina phaseolina (strain MS6) TaxID=1126212 RepID=K2R8T0_MACPH|nr:Alcohol dehydrogenase superfamily zinc-containing [Macrophomina phaseolina MS6]